jgi:hypothetical protein
MALRSLAPSLGTHVQSIIVVATIQPIQQKAYGLLLVLEEFKVCD